VESFVSSSLLPAAVRGTQYPYLFHVTDWFKTIATMSGRSDLPSGLKALDGFDHFASIRGETEAVAASPRSYMLYNYYKRVLQLSGDVFTDTPFAVRNERYKLMHTYDSSTAGAW
jgi:hypothetical protein